MNSNTRKARKSGLSCHSPVMKRVDKDNILISRDARPLAKGYNVETSHKLTGNTQKQYATR